MKGFCKRIIACFSVAAMLAAMLGTLGAAAEQEAPVPEVTWVENGENDAQLSISYTDGSGYGGKYSLTALYDSNRALVGVGCGVLDQSGAANYAVNKPAEGAATVKCFIWNDLNTVEPVVPVYETTYGNFIKNIVSVPEFKVTSGLGLRNSFETGRFQIFQNGVKNDIKMEIVDNTSAHTGTKCAKISGRTTERTTMRTKLTKAEIGDNVTLNVNAFMKKPEYITEDAEFYINIGVPTTAGTQWKTGEAVKASDTKWHKVSYSLDLSPISNKNGDYVVELGARTGSPDSYNYIDYYADDFTVTCTNALKTVIFDDIKSGGMKWDFETGNTADYVTDHRETNVLSDTNRWTRTYDKQTLKVVSTSKAEFCNTDSTTTNESVKKEDADAVKTPPTGSKYMLEVNSPQKDWSTTHITARIKLSKADLVPGKTYQVSFWAFGNSKKRALYMGLVPHEANGMPTTFSGGEKYTGTNGKGTAFAKNQRAPGIIQYDDTPCTSASVAHNKGTDYKVNYVASMPRSWHQYTATLTPKEAHFETDGGYADLCFVMTYNMPEDSGKVWYDKDILLNEKLYLDEIEITEVPEGSLAALAYDGMYTKRATFESDNMDMFSPDTRASVVLTDTEANTGSYCAEFSNRKDNWTSLGSSIKGADISSKITASCFIKKNSLKM